MLSASEPKPVAFTQSLSVDFSGADQPCTPPQDGAGFALNMASELDTKVSKGQGGVQARKFMNRQGDKGEERKEFFFLPHLCHYCSHYISCSGIPQCLLRDVKRKICQLIFEREM